MIVDKVWPELGKNVLQEFKCVAQEGYIEELTTCFYLDTALLKSSESVLSET